MIDDKRVASPPDDGGHVGSMTTPEQTMIESDPGAGAAPELHRDRQKVVNRRRSIGVPLTIGVTVLFLIIILLVFTPRL